MSLRVISALLVLPPLVAQSQENVSRQKFLLFLAEEECKKTVLNLTRPTESGLYCPPEWDTVMCWPVYLSAGRNISQPCPNYIHGFNPAESARRWCTEEGRWGTHPDGRTNTSWTDYSSCEKTQESFVPDIIEEHISNIYLISIVGYAISLGTLAIATLILLSFRKLHCQRNTIHINLFLSFMLRAVLFLLRSGLLVEQFALPTDIKYATDGRLLFINEGTHWECKLLNVLWQYSLGANYMWIFVEGIYLHTLIFFAVFSQSKRFFKLYILIGWMVPLVFITIWILVRIFKNNTLCWNTHEHGYYWILNAPIVTSISVNFFFFLNIIRVLFTKIRNCNTRDPSRYRQLAKSTLVLIPLFGVYYIIFMVWNASKEPRVVVVHMYTEMTLNSFQGTVVAFLFCFMNGEVRAELTKSWRRQRLRSQSLVSGRSTRTLSIASCHTVRDRSSLTLVGQPLISRDSKAVNSLNMSPHSNRGSLPQEYRCPVHQTEVCSSDTRSTTAGRTTGSVRRALPPIDSETEQVEDSVHRRV